MKYLLLVFVLFAAAWKVSAQIPDMGISQRMVDTCTIDFAHPEPGQFIRMYPRNFLEDSTSARSMVSPVFFDTVFLILDRLPGCTFEIASHTSSVGPATRNMNVSQRRSISFASYLIRFCGMDKTRLITAGYGETCPINECSEGIDCPAALREKNQRLEITILSVPE